MGSDFVRELIRAFKVVAFIGFITMGVMATGAIRSLLLKYFPGRFEKKRWPFIPIAVFVFFVLLYIYNLLFLRM